MCGILEELGRKTKRATVRCYILPFGSELILFWALSHQQSIESAKFAHIACFSNASASGRLSEEKGVG